MLADVSVSPSVLSPSFIYVPKLRETRRAGAQLVQNPTDSDQLVLALNDRWLTPIDDQVRTIAPFKLPIHPDGAIEGTSLTMTHGTWYSLEISWPYNKESDAITLGGDRTTTPFNHTPVLPHGFSYLHLQSSLEPDEDGFLIGPVSVRVD